MTLISRDDYISNTDYVNYRSRQAGDIPAVKARLAREQAKLKALQERQALTIDRVLNQYFEKIVAMLQTADKSLCAYGHNGWPHLVEGWHNVHRARSQNPIIHGQLITYCDTHAYRVTRFMEDGAISAAEDRNQAWARMLKACYPDPVLFNACAIEFGTFNLATILHEVDPNFPTTVQNLLDLLVISDEAIAQEIHQPASV